MARPKDKHDRRVSVLLRGAELANLEILADMEGRSKSEVLRDLLNKEVSRRKRNGRWEDGADTGEP